VYIGSVRTFYRTLDENDPVRERRAVVRHPQYVKPQLVATAPNQVWSWGITKLPGAARGIWFHLYVVLDVFSRYVVGWLIAPNGSAPPREGSIERSGWLANCPCFSYTLTYTSTDGKGQRQ